MPVDKWVFLELRALAAAAPARVNNNSSSSSSHSTTTHDTPTADDSSFSNSNTPIADNKVAVVTPSPPPTPIAHAQPPPQQPIIFQTASHRVDHTPWYIEQQLRRTTCSFIENLAALVEIPDAPTVAAQIFVQRFYVLHAFSAHDRFLVATAALFLAAKTEEFPIKVRLLTECAMFLLVCSNAPPKEKLLKKSRHRQQHPERRASTSSTYTTMAPTPRANNRTSATGKPVAMSQSLGNDPQAAHDRHIDCLNALLEVVDVGEVETTATKVLLLERVLLQTLAFDVCVAQPFAYVAPAMARVFALDAVDPMVSYDNVRHIAFLLLADALKSGLCLAFNAVELAAGAVYLACLYRNSITQNVTTELNAPWWSVLGLTQAQLSDVARGFLWMFESDASDGATTTTIEGLSADFRALWDVYRPEQNLPDLEAVRTLDAAAAAATTTTQQH